VGWKLSEMHNDLKTARRKRVTLGGPAGHPQGSASLAAAPLRAAL
jgi:hypothetical protein